MEVHVSSLRAEVDKYNSLVSEYESCMLNLYNVLGQTSSYWQDTRSPKFIDNIYDEKNQASKIISTMSEIKGAWEFILNSYSALGNEIKFELSMRGAVQTGFMSYISKLDAVIAAYDSLNMGFGPDEAGDIYWQRQRAADIKWQANDLKGKVDEYFNRIQDIEQAVSSRISGISISVIKESNPSDFV